MVDIKKGINRLFPKVSRKEEFDFSPENYIMKEIYDTEKLIVGKLEYISSTVTRFGPMIQKTSQNYIFEPVIIDGMVKYQEVFTGFTASDSKEGYFGLPYVVDIEKLTEVLADYEQTKIPRLGMLLVLNAVNPQIVKCNDERILSKKNQNR